MPDPDERLRKLRELVARAAGSGWAGDPFLLDELATGIRDLDKALSHGERLPAAWCQEQKT